MFSEVAQHILYSHCLIHNICCGKHYYTNVATSSWNICEHRWWTYLGFL